MKNVLILAMCSLLSAGVLCASTGPISANLQAPSVFASEGAGSISLRAGDGGPAPLCAPGQICNIQQEKLQAGDGGPAPLCAPGQHCNIQQEKLQAGDGGPAPLCAPGQICNIQQEKLLIGL